MQSSSLSCAIQPSSPRRPSPSLSPSPSPSPSLSASGLTCPSLHNPKTQDVFQSIVKGRKSWKTLRGGEIVWPPELEAALIEGLEQYTPDDSRETRLLGRFPMRNRYISEYIYHKTGKRRTAKQVGSRLQQLRDTCGGRQLLKLLTPYRPQNRASRPSPLHLAGNVSDSDSNSDASAPATPTEAHATLQSLLYRGVGGLGRDEEPRNIIYIDLLPENTPVGSGVTQDPPPIPSSSESNIVRTSQKPRRIRDIDPTITLLAPSSMAAKSHFMVRSRTGLVHSEVTEMTLIGPAPGGAQDERLYSTKLIPSFWNEICESSDPTQYTVLQKVTQEPYHDISSPLFFAAYKFTMPFPSVTGATASAADAFKSGEPMIQSSPSPSMDLDLDDLLTFDSETFNELMPFNKSIDMYDLNVCLTTEWDMYSPSQYASPATSFSSEAFSEGYMSPSMAEIPIITL